jgi:hypothetical protein
MRKLLNELKRLNVPVIKKQPWCVHEDGMIVLGGAYDGIHLSIGNLYYYVVREGKMGGSVSSKATALWPKNCGRL